MLAMHVKAVGTEYQLLSSGDMFTCKTITPCRHSISYKTTHFHLATE